MEVAILVAQSIWKGISGMNAEWDSTIYLITYVLTCSAFQYIIKRACSERAPRMPSLMTASTHRVSPLSAQSLGRLIRAWFALIFFLFPLFMAKVHYASVQIPANYRSEKALGLGLFANGSLRGAHFWQGFGEMRFTSRVYIWLACGWLIAHPRLLVTYWCGSPVSGEDQHWLQPMTLIG